jgi:hypothetical protein
MSGEVDRIAPIEVNREWVSAKCEYFVDTQLWPPHRQIDSNGWLSNFQDGEMGHAIHLLNALMYYSDPLVNDMLVASFQGLSIHIGCARHPLARAQAIWRSFVDEVLITHISGEVPSTTDSGHIFARKMRDLLNLPEDRVVDPPQALAAILEGRARRVVFVDDFIGTGNQFVATWKRSYLFGANSTASFQLASRARHVQVYLCPVICTEFALTNVLRPNCPGLIINPAHVLPSSYSAHAPDSIVWPARLKATSRAFLKLTGVRAGLPDTDGHDVRDWQGFNKLGLTLAFSHGVPDATLPIYYWSQNGWKPLIRQR